MDIKIKKKGMFLWLLYIVFSKGKGCVRNWEYVWGAFF